MKNFTFVWPNMLWLLAVMPLLALMYWLVARRRARVALAYAGLVTAGAGAVRWRRAVPPILYFLALSALLAAVSRPSAVVSIPTRHDTVILAVDVSRSMRAGDIEPNRLAGAQAAAKAFIEEQPRHTKVGIVSFAAAALVVQPPTSNREELFQAIDRFELQRGTALGSAILVSVKSIFPDFDFDPLSANGRRQGRSFDPNRGDPPPPAAPGSYGSAVIVLLTDGNRTTGPDALEAAKMAAERGIRVYTVGIGTLKGETIAADGWQMRVRLDEDTLKRIASITEGEYMHASNAKELKHVYDALSARFVVEKKEVELGAFLVAGAALLSLLAAAFSLAWFNRIL